MKRMTVSDWDSMYTASLYYELQAKRRTETDIKLRIETRSDRRNPDLRQLREWVAAGFPKEEVK